MKQIIEMPKKFCNWRVKEGKLFHRIPDPLHETITHEGSEWKYVVPERLRAQILYESHDSPMSAHQGIDKTFERIRQDYFWPRMFLDVVEYVKLCPICQKTKVSQRQAVGNLGGRIPEYPLESHQCVVPTDVMEFPRSKNGFTHLVVFQDLFTKWVELAPIRAANGKNIKAAFDDLILTRWGAPRVFLSDNSREYINRPVQDMTEEYNIFHSKTPPYHAQANLTECVNRCLKTMIVAYLGQDHREWDLHVREFRFAFNTSYHSSTKYSPAFPNFGREPLAANTTKQLLEKGMRIELSTMGIGLKSWVE